MSEEVLHTQVPALLLQPIVENAIKHGISKHPNGGAISVKASRSNGSKVTIEVCNDVSKRSSTSKLVGYGIGTSNVSKRLEQLYGDEQSFIQELDNDKYITTITLPYQVI